MTALDEKPDSHDSLTSHLGDITQWWHHSLTSHGIIMERYRLGEKSDSHVALTSHLDGITQWRYHFIQMISLNESHDYLTSHLHDITQWYHSLTSHNIMRRHRRGKFSTNLSPSGRIRQVQNTTRCHNSGTMNLKSIRVSTVRGHAPYKYPPRNTMPRSPGNQLRISWSDTSFSPTVSDIIEWCHQW